MRGTVAYEFTIDEAGFLEWAESIKWPEDAKAEEMSIRRIGEPHRVLRYWGFPTTEGEDRFAMISRGYYVDWSKKNYRLTIAYDLDAQRAYFYR
jgi:hypothetical protein